MTSAPTRVPLTISVLSVSKRCSRVLSWLTEPAMAASACSRTFWTTRAALLRLSARFWAAATADCARSGSCGAALYCWIASLSFWIIAAGDVSSSGSDTVWSRRSSNSTIAFCDAEAEVADIIFSSSALFEARVTEATLTPPLGVVTTLADLREACGSLARATLRETTEVCSDVAARPESATSRPTESDMRGPF